MPGWIQHVRHLARVPEGSVPLETADRPRKSGVIEKTAFHLRVLPVDHLGHPREGLA